MWVDGTWDWTLRGPRPSKRLSWVLGESQTFRTPSRTPVTYRLTYSLITLGRNRRYDWEEGKVKSGVEDTSFGEPEGSPIVTGESRQT